MSQRDDYVSGISSGFRYRASLSSIALILKVFFASEVAAFSRILMLDLDLRHSGARYREHFARSPERGAALGSRRDSWTNSLPCLDSLRQSLLRSARLIRLR